MVKSRQESLEIYKTNGRADLAETEAGEIAIIEAYLPQMMSDEAMEAAIKEAIAETGAASIKDMGKVIASMKQKHGGSFDAAKASVRVKTLLG